MLQNYKTTLIAWLKPRKHRLVFLGVTFVSILAVMWPVLAFPQWPENGENLRFFDRTIIYAEHFKHGDLFPIWSSDDAYGLGTPMPLFYHKLFYYCAAVLYLVIGNVKIAVVISLMLLMVVGAWGARRTLRALGVNKTLPLLFVPQLMIISTYSVTNWLHRGAMAEFSAMMIVPWLLVWCVNLLKKREMSYSIVLLFTLLYYAHSVIALFSSILIVVAYVIYVRKSEKKRAALKIKRVVTISLLTGLCMAPDLIMKALFLTDYNLNKVIPPNYQASNRFLSYSRYFFDVKFMFWVPVVFIVVAMVGRRLYAKSVTQSKARKDEGVGVYLLICLVIYTFLLFPFSSFIYQSVSTLQFIQFSWRLLTFIYPLSVFICVYYLIKTHLLTKIMNAWFGLALFLVLVLSGLRQYHDTRFFDYTKHEKFQSSGLDQRMISIGEYLPVTYKDDGSLMSVKDTKEMYIALSKQERLTVESLAAGPTGCVEAARTNRLPEERTRVYTFVCATDGEVALPISFNSYTLLKDLYSGEVIRYERSHPQDPRIIIKAKKGTNSIEATFPTYTQVLSMVL